MGADVNEVFPSVNDFQQLSDMFKDDQYIFNMHHHKHPTNHQRNRKIGLGTSPQPIAYLLLKDTATKQDLLRGLLFAFVVRQLWSDLSKINTTNTTSTSSNNNNSTSDSSPLNPHDTWELFHRARALLSQQCINTHLLYDGHTVSLGERLINDVIDSEWHVEELLLETRHARLVVPKTI